MDQMRFLTSLILSFIICTNIAHAKTFKTQGEYFNYNLPNDLCVLHDEDPIENIFIQNIKATSPNVDIPVSFVDCNSLRKIKSGIDVNHFTTFGAIKNLKQKYIFSNQKFIEEMSKKFNVDSDSLNQMIDKSLKDGTNNLPFDADVSSLSTKYLGRDEDTIYLAGISMIDGEKAQFVSAISLHKGVAFGIEIYNFDKSLRTNDLLNVLINLTSDLR
jgi:hypothetical protein